VQLRSYGPVIDRRLKIFHRVWVSFERPNFFSLLADTSLYLYCTMPRTVIYDFKNIRFGINLTELSCDLQLNGDR